MILKRRWWTPDIWSQPTKTRPRLSAATSSRPATRLAITPSKSTTPNWRSIRRILPSSSNVRKSERTGWQSRTTLRRPTPSWTWSTSCRSVPTNTSWRVTSISTNPASHSRCRTFPWTRPSWERVTPACHTAPQGPATSWPATTTTSPFRLTCSKKRFY